jgi:hypothetical protein
MRVRMLIRRAVFTREFFIALPVHYSAGENTLVPLSATTFASTDVRITLVVNERASSAVFWSWAQKDRTVR